MTDVNPHTGEVAEAAPATVQTWMPTRDRAEELITQRPEDPAGVAMAMHQIEQLLLEIADFFLRVNNERYDAERAHSRRFHAALAQHAERHPVTVARALAAVDAEPEKREYDAKRALFHYCEDTQKALKQKHFGLMNVNKNLHSVMYQQGSRS